MSKIRIAMIGVGDMGTGHCLGFDNVPNCEITWICDPHEPNVSRALRYVRNNKPSVCKDYRELLEKDDVDAVVISVPNYLHREVAVPFLEKGKDVFLEKPVASTLRDCDAILEAARKSGSILQIGLVYRYSNLYRRMYKEIQSGRFEQVTMLWCKEFRDPFPPVDWFYDHTKSGGALVEKNCHHFDIFNWMANSKPVRVFASGGQHVIKNGTERVITNSYTHYPPKVIGTSSIVDHAWVIVEYESGCKANLGLCMYLQPRNCSDDGLEIGVIGSSGVHMVAKNDKSIGIFGGRDYTKEYLDIDVTSDSIGNGHTGGQTQRHEFIDCVLHRRQPFATGDVGRSALLVALAAEKSIREERYVYLSELEEGVDGGR